MQNLVESLSITVSSFALLLIVVVVVLNLYLIKRNGFHVSVNCWFCNTWSKVLHANRNSFICPSCLQYNGFAKDGGYNKVIEKQYDTSQSSLKTSNKTEPLSNGLCTYCNNNQRLKIHQLANFTALNEDNYDIEVEHFRKQLEKSYKLCTKCELILKRTIDHQHAWIFGNHLKNFKNKSLNSLKMLRENHIKQTTFLKLVRYCLVALTILVLCQILNVKVEYPSIKNMEKFIPRSFTPYTVLMNDFYMLLVNTSRNFTEELNSLKKLNLEFETNFLSVISSISFMLQAILIIGERTFNWWKINEMLGWILLIMTSSISFNDEYTFYIAVSQTFAATTLLYSYLTNKSSETPKKTSSKKKYAFQKLKTPKENLEEEDEEYIQTSSNLSMKSKKSPYKNLNTSHCQFYRASSPIQRFPCHNGVNNNSFTTAKTTSLLNGSYNGTSSISLGDELHHSLDNLHLNSLNFKPRPCTSPVFSVNSVKRPVLTPPKLKNVTQNSWAAGGFWKNDVSAFPASAEYLDPSPSSSQTSGFFSNNAFQSLPPSREESVCGDAERTSFLSEPTYHVNPFISNMSSKNDQRLYYKSNNTFYPVLSQNNMLVLHSNMPQYAFDGSYPNFPVNSFQARGSNLYSPVLFPDKQPSRLFKNMQGLGMEVLEESFRKPQF